MFTRAVFWGLFGGIVFCSAFGSIQVPCALQVKDDFLEQKVALLEKMTPEEIAELEDIGKEVAGEFEKFIEAEASRLGIAPEQYFEREFSKLFEGSEVVLAKGEASAPGMQVGETDFSMPSASSIKGEEHSIPKDKDSKRKSLKQNGDQGQKTDHSSSKSSVRESWGEMQGALKSTAQVGSTASVKRVGQRGNWLKKLYYFREGEKLVSEAAKMLNAIRLKRKDFYGAILNEIDENMDSFFKKAGVERGNAAGLAEYIEAVVGHKVNQLFEMEKSLSSNLDDNSDFVLFQVEEKLDALKVELADIKNEMELLVDLDKVALERISTIDKHLDVASEDFSSMEVALREIDETFSHIEAMQRYDLIEGYYDRISAISKYINDTGVKNFERIKDNILSNIAKAEERIEKIHDETTKLVEKLEKMSMRTSSTPAAKSTNKTIANNQGTGGTPPSGGIVGKVAGKVRSVFAKSS